MSELGLEIDLIATVKRPPLESERKVVQSYVNRLHVVPRAPMHSGLWRPSPMQVTSRSPLRRVRLDGEYDAVLLESEFVAPILDNPTLRASRRILRVHNDEPKFFADLAASEPHPLRRFYYKHESSRFAKWLPSLWRSIDEFWFISRDYAEEWKGRYPERDSAAYWMPPSAAPKLAAFSHQSDSCGVLFAGNLVVPTNLEGLTWYLDYVHPLLLDIPDYRLTIAGSLLGGTMPRRLAEAQHDPRCTVAVDLPDLTPLYRNAAVFINPMLRGTSVKMKTVNAVENGMALVTTAVGNEVTGFADGLHLLVCDTPETFASGIRELIESRERRRSMAASAQQFLVDNYRFEHIVVSRLGLNCHTKEENYCTASH